MANQRNQFLASGIALALLLGVGCGKSGTPTSPATTGSAPSIASLAPSTPQPGPNPQTLTVGGSNFFAGLTFTLRGPDGSSTTYNAQSISALTSTAFTVNVVIATPGNWVASVKNIDGQESSGAAFATTGTESSGPPSINAITPGVIFRSAATLQSFSINGQNFRAGATVTVRNGNGVEVTSSITSTSDTVITALAAFATVGTYSVTVRNPDGMESSAYSLTVSSGGT